ncbi:CPBP family intramembrane glutamic endopeptidase [Alkaliphilus peptidifermentans]|uniref:CAAX protease self-immunity n=1 Tax=Alkaliphilus peptidifermentans DSM 18978 TaxID=1120976 RepID=A0A1G5GUZ9_9FIRM|nr:CPBP family intramembrane glutamic endopeptidase [Alkaliphilus peptidifermentans]SCY55197.1 CAAX protease self-immunity [Alkaliphilus peptidifermentans DSM 18978]
MTNINIKTNKNIGREHYLFIAIVSVMYYILWNIFEFFLAKHFNPNIQSYSAIVTFFITVSFCHIITHYSPCFLFAYIKNINLIKLLRLNKVTLKQLFLSFVIFIAFNLISVYLLTVQDIILSYFNISFKMNDYIVADNVATLIVLVITVGILIPVGEEFFYRGFLISGMESINKYFAITASAFLFAIYHNNPHRLITLFLFSILLGLIVHYTNSLIPGIIMHIITNTVFVVYGFIQGKESMMQQYGDLSSTPVSLLNNNIVLFIVFLISSTVCILSLRKLRAMAVQEDSYNVLSRHDRNSGLFIIITTYIILTGIFLLRGVGYFNISY